METQSLWTDIDYAERCLVSAMYEEAAEVASSTLRILVGDSWNQAWSQTLPSRQRDECVETVTMVEAAGMVLLQAVNQMERPSNIFHELISIFDGVEKVPYSLILTGTCLQLATGFHSASQQVIQDYLSGWRSVEASPDGLMAKVVEFPSSESPDVESSTNEIYSYGVAHTVYLSKINYLQLTEIYAIEILAKLHKNYVAAHLWIQNSGVSQEEKQIISQRLRLVSQSQKPNVSNRRKQRNETRPHVIGGPMEGIVEANDGAREVEDEASISVKSSEAASVQSTAVSEESKSRVVKGFGIWRLPFVRTVMRLAELVIIRLSLISGSKRMARQRNLPRIKMLFTGAFASVILYAMLRNRCLLKRRIMELTKFASVCLTDLWRLAFSVHLNPLAAV